jgi:5-formyltetrahydrofolate cyclo-ligase
MAGFFLAGPVAAWNAARRPIVSGYWPIFTEIDTRPLLTQLHEQGYEVALPVAPALSSVLVFRKWEPGMDMTLDATGVAAPPASSPLLSPDIVMAALLAFDAKGNRLGYGGGYYDATLKSMRARRKVVSVGIAFADQEVDEIAAESYDQNLDWIVTERYARQFRG